MSLIPALLVLSNKQKLPPKTRVKSSREVKGHSSEKLARINPSGNVLITVTPHSHQEKTKVGSNALLGVECKETEKLQCKFRPTDKT